MRTAESWEQQINLWESGTPELIKLIRAIQKDALLESAEIINTRMSLLETWGDDETSENIHIKEIRALRPVYDAILARAKEVETQPHSTDEKKINPL